MRVDNRGVRTASRVLELGMVHDVTARFSRASSRRALNSDLHRGKPSPHQFPHSRNGSGTSPCRSTSSARIGVFGNHSPRCTVRWAGWPAGGTRRRSPQQAPGCWPGGSAVQGRGARCPTLAVALGGSHRPGGIGVGKARQALLAIHHHAPVLLVVEIDLEPVPEDEAFSDIVRSGSHVFTVRFPGRAGRVTPIQPSAQARSRVAWALHRIAVTRRRRRARVSCRSPESHSASSSDAVAPGVFLISPCCSADQLRPPDQAQRGALAETPPRGRPKCQAGQGAYAPKIRAASRARSTMRAMRSTP